MKNLSSAYENLRGRKYPACYCFRVEKLRADVLDIRGTNEQGLTDDLLWEKVQREKRLLITTDKGFAGQRAELHFGILIVRLRQPNEQKIHARIMQAINQYTEDEWQGFLIVMRDTVQSVWRNI